jgi:DNA-binding NarL/FixJ family response regulator
VLLWLVELSFVDEEVASFELDCESSAAAVPTWANPSPIAASAQSSAKHHRMPPASVFAQRGHRPRLSGSGSPRPGGALYDPCVGARILLVEPNRIVRAGIRAELSRNGAEVVAEAASGDEAIAAATMHAPDVVLLDVQLPDAPAAEICEALTARLPETRVIVLAERGREAEVGAAIDCGARAYVLKDAEDLDLGVVVERVLAGESVIDPRAAAALIDSRRTTDEARLSRQELKVLRLVAEGLTNPEIGRRLYLSRHTVKEYLSHAMRKLEVGNRIEAVRKATELGLIEGGPAATGGLAYNRTGEPARSADLKVTPLKIDHLRAVGRADDPSDQSR